MGYKLSILIPCLNSRAEMFSKLLSVLSKQMNDNELNNKIEIVDLFDNGEISIGEKRNKLLEMANGEYVCFIDDDDDVSDNYIKNIFYGINKGVDCCSLRGVITWDGERPELFEHSIMYNEYKTNHTGYITYERYPNHLNSIKSTIAKQFKFPLINHGEDTDWATQVKNSGLIKTEHFIDSVIYHYNFITNK